MNLSSGFKNNNEVTGSFKSFAMRNEFNNQIFSCSKVRVDILKESSSWVIEKQYIVHSHTDTDTF